MSKVVLLDIDYTLFNADAFRDRTYPQLKKILDQEDSPAYHEKIKHIEKSLIAAGGYEPVTFAKLLMQALELPEKRKEVENLFYDKRVYEDSLYPDVRETMERLSKMDLILGIVSKGENSFQRRKIEPIKQYFQEENIFISNDKIAEIARIKKTYTAKNVLVVDDSQRFLYVMKENWENLLVVLIERENRYEVREDIANFIPTARIKSLDEIFPLVDKLGEN